MYYVQRAMCWVRSMYRDRYYYVYTTYHIYIYIYILIPAVLPPDKAHQARLISELAKINPVYLFFFLFHLGHLATQIW